MNTAAIPATAPLDRSQVENLLPLVPLQQGLLFHALLAPASGAYVPQVVLTLQGALDGAALRGAWEQTLARHGALRSSFHWEQREQPFQVVWRGAPLPWVEHDWSAASAPEQQARLRALLAAQRGEPFDLRRPPLMRLALLRLGAQRWQLVWAHHHLLLDGWSASLVLREVFARLLGAPLPPAPRPYADFVAWQRERSRTHDDSLAWWRRELQGLPPQAPLPGLQAAPRGGSVQPAIESAALDAAARQRLRALMQARGLTLATVLQGTLALLLRRHGLGGTAADSIDVLYGHTVSGRPAELPGALAMVGLFVNTAPLRVRLRAAQPAADALVALQARRAEAAAHEHLPLRALQALAGGQPLFDLLLVIENYPAGGALPAPTGALQLQALQIDEATHYGLTLQAADGDALTLSARWDARRADAAMPRALLQRWCRLLQALAAAPDAPLGRLSMLDEAEAARAAARGDGGPALGGAPLTSLADRFEQQARRCPDATALRCGGAAISYRTLDRCANQLAWTLRERGVGTEDVVALRLQRSFELIVALLAVQKAGAAWLPVDAEQPPARAAAMLADARAALLLHAGETAALPADTPALDIRGCAGQGRDDAPPRSSHPLQAAYLIYTSGSTGTPKGVLNHQAGIANRLLWMQRWLDLQPGQRVLHKTPLGFDVSVWELWLPLLEGATLVLAPPGAHRDREALAALIEAERIEVLHFVPAMLDDFLQADALAQRCASLRHIVCSGEALSGALQQRTLQRLPQAQLHNLYGPTEAAVDVTAWRCTADDGDAPVPIGRPIAGIRIRVLDADGQPLPPFATGRLFIGGIGVARGYRGRAALTAERFVPDPFERGALLYDSGDLARWRDDGAIDYLGRADEQLKLRGVRIEPGEIEAALLRRHGVRQAVVRLWPDAPGGAQLVAWLVGEAGESAPDEAALQRALRAELPDAMVPARFVVLDALPLGPNGKPDRKALPWPDSGEHAPRAPRTASESQVLAVWQEVLQLPAPPGIDDNFFALGGHSLIAMRVVSRLHAASGIELPIAAVFEHPTAEALAAELERRRAPAAGWREVEL